VTASGKLPVLGTQMPEIEQYDTIMDPVKEIPGIMIISGDITEFGDYPEIDGHFYVAEGSHTVTSVNHSARLRGVWFLAPGALFFTDLGIGGEGELTQVLGNGLEQYSAGPLFLNANMDIYNSVIASSGGTQMGATENRPYFHTIRDSYVKNCGGNGVWLGELWNAAIIIIARENEVLVERCRFYDNLVCDIQVEGTNLKFLAEDSVFGSYYIPEGATFARSYGIDFEINGRVGLSATFIDCRMPPPTEKFFETPTSNYPPGTMYHSYKLGQIVFKQTRPGIAEPVTIWPRESPLNPMDFNGDGVVGLDDLFYIADDFGLPVEVSDFGVLYDMDGTGIVDLPDIREVVRGVLGIPRTFTLSEAVVAISEDSAKRTLAKEIAMGMEFSAPTQLARAVWDDPELSELLTPYRPTAVMDEGSATPKEFGLEQNYPNPFNAATTIRFALAEQSIVDLKVYDTLGRVVKTIITGQRLDAGVWTETWDGRDSNGLPAATGVYVFVLKVGDRTFSNKAVLAR